MDRIGALDCLTSVVVESELAVGAFKAPNRDTMFEKLDALLGRFSVLPIDREIARKYAEIRASLERRGTTIGSNDAYIAATALTHDLTLLTRNLREFGRVEGLRVETV
jgi:tRNA(fMet)-specific endonuclease VapC